RRPSRSTLFPYPSLFRSYDETAPATIEVDYIGIGIGGAPAPIPVVVTYSAQTVRSLKAQVSKPFQTVRSLGREVSVTAHTVRSLDRKSTRLNSSHVKISD